MSDRSPEQSGSCVHARSLLWLPLVYCVLMLTLTAASAATGADAQSLTHPLMPGLRSAELHNPEWPRTLHDNLASGFSPLVCGMSEAPRVWATVELGGRADWVQRLEDAARGDRLLVYDGRMRCIDVAGDVLWTNSESGTPAYFGPYAPNDASSARRVLLLAGGNRLAMLDADDGQTIWNHVFEPPHVGVRVRVDDILSDVPGLEAAVVLAHGDEGCVINFPPDGQPRFIWQRQIVVPGEFDERNDHGCGLELDLSDPERPLIWNVRRFRCRALDAHTGEIVSGLSYKIGGEPRRNYGRWALGTGPDGERLVVSVAEQVQLHVHAVRLNADGECELAWQHYYGEVYKEAPGVALKMLAIADLDHDGVTEVAYCVRDPAHELRSFVRIRDAATGHVEFELADHWGVAVLEDVGSDEANILLTLPAPNGTMPTRGDQAVYLLNTSERPHQIGTIAAAQLFSVPTVHVNGRDEILVRQSVAAEAPTLVRYDVRSGALLEAGRATVEGGTDAAVAAVFYDAQGRLLLVGSDVSGRLVARRLDGERVWDIATSGGPLPTLSAADLDADGKAELLALTPQGRLEVRSFADGANSRTLFNVPYVARWRMHSPVVYDLMNDGGRCVIAPAEADDGTLEVVAYHGDGSVAWRTPLPVAAESVNSFVAHAGQFLPGPQAAVAVSIMDSRRTNEGTFLLDGRSGKLLWFKGLYHDGGIVMPYRAHGIPTAVDVDGDSVQEIGIDMLSYMAFLRGSDGEFALLRHSANIRSDGALYAGRLYGTYLPLWFGASQSEPHWFAKGGHGPFGLMNPDFTTGVWREDFGYDVPPNIGMIDVDGDGDLEVGYAAQHDRRFVCRDAMTGEIEWEVELPVAPSAPCMSADVDGDGRGEFLIGAFCLGVADNGKRALRWCSPRPLGWSIVADFDGDGLGEIACAHRGGVDILKGKQQ